MNLFNGKFRFLIALGFQPTGSDEFRMTGVLDHITFHFAIDRGDLAVAISPTFMPSESFSLAELLAWAQWNDLIEKQLSLKGTASSVALILFSMLPILMERFAPNRCEDTIISLQRFRR